MPHPSSHLHPTGRPHPADPDWDGWSTAWTAHVPVLTGRTDLTVVVAPGAGGGADACFYPDRRRIEVDAVHIGHPDVADPRRAGHKRLVPTAYGLLVHEAAHATHSQWATPPDTPPVVAHVAALLEESRAEHRQRSRRRGDRRWLHHTVTTLLDPGDAPVDDAWHAGQLAGLLLARVDARILASRDVRRVRAAVTTVLGRRRLRQLRDLWRTAHTLDDTDATGMIDLAWRWCLVLGIDPRHQPEVPTPDLGVFAGVLAAALADYLAAALGLTPAAYTATQHAHRHGPPATWTHRDPTADEHAAARQLAARLRAARTHTRQPQRVPAPAPPGRLRTRHALAADAQRAAGGLPTAAPWQRRTTQPPPKPALRLAVIVDVSGSMRAYAAPMSSAAWTLAHAAHHNHAQTATIAFGDAVTLLVPPRHQPTHVLDLRTSGGTATFIDAVKLADQLLDLRHRATLRLLAVVSDGALANIDPSQRLITTLHRAGCPVLWLRPAGLPGHTFDHTTTLTVADPVEAVGHIADAAVAALERA